jgi:tetratricopeptide (TPR) repeat protein
VRRGVAVLAGIVAFGAVAAATVPVTADRAAGMGLRDEAAGDYAAAVQSFDTASWRAWWEPDYGFAAGQAAYTAGDVQGAQQRFEATAASFEQSLEPAWASARVAVELGQWDKAADWYRHVLVLEPNDEDLAAEATEVIEFESGTP